MRLMMGDCLERMKEIKDGSVDLVLTDPPYGTTACKWYAVIPFEPMWAQVWRVLKANGAAVFTASQPFTSALVISEVKNFRYSWVWNKVNRCTGYGNANKMPMKWHEDIVVFYRRLPTYNPQKIKCTPYVASHGKRKAADRAEVYKDGGLHSSITVNNGLRHPSSIIDIKGNVRKESGHHPTQKPVALMEYMIRTYTNEDETVLDFTMGSGTTGVACANTNRNFIGIERDPTYFQIAQQRIEEAQRRLL